MIYSVGNIEDQMGNQIEMQTFYDRALLSRLTPNLVYYQFAQKRSIGKNSGTSISFRRFKPLPLLPTASYINEGEIKGPGNGNQLEVQSLRVDLKTFGDYLELHDSVDYFAIDPVLTESAELLGEQAALSLDTNVRDVVATGACAIYANNKLVRSSLAKTDILTSEDIKRAVKMLRRSNAKPLDGGYYVGIISPDAAFDLMGDPLWQDVSKYSDGANIMKGEIGKLFGVRFVETTNIKKMITTGGVDIQLSTIFGKDAYGVVDLEGANKPTMIVKPYGSAGSSDPLNQLATVAWKSVFATARLNESAIIRIEHAVTT